MPWGHLPHPATVRRLGQSAGAHGPGAIPPDGKGSNNAGNRPSWKGRETPCRWHWRRRATTRPSSGASPRMSKPWSAGWNGTSWRWQTLAMVTGANFSTSSSTNWNSGSTLTPPKSAPSASPSSGNATGYRASSKVLDGKLAAIALRFDVSEHQVMAVCLLQRKPETSHTYWQHRSSQACSLSHLEGPDSLCLCYPKSPIFEPCRKRQQSFVRIGQSFGFSDFALSTPASKMAFAMPNWLNTAHPKKLIKSIGIRYSMHATNTIPTHSTIWSGK